MVPLSVSFSLQIEDQGLVEFYFSASSIEFSSSVVSDSLLPHGLDYDRLPYPSPTPGACSNPCP